MSMSDCPKYWDTLCTCGYEYKDWTVENIDDLINVLAKLRDEKLNIQPKPKPKPKDPNTRKEIT